MNKKEIRVLLFCILGIMVVFPIVINYLMFFNVIPVKGDTVTWIPTLGTFWGAVLGGLVSGILTLIGVRLSIKASFDAIEKQRLEQEKNIERLEQKEIEEKNKKLIAEITKIQYEIIKIKDEFSFLESADQTLLERKGFYTGPVILRKINTTNLEGISLLENEHLQFEIIHLVDFFQNFSLNLNENINAMEVHANRLKDELSVINTHEKYLYYERLAIVNAQIERSLSMREFYWKKFLKEKDKIEELYNQLVEEKVKAKFYDLM